jgi:hypothetical protein
MFVVSSAATLPGTKRQVRGGIFFECAGDVAGQVKTDRSGAARGAVRQGAVTSARA